MYDSKIWLIKNKREEMAFDIRALVQPYFEEALNPFKLSSILGIAVMRPQDIIGASTNCVDNLCNHYSNEWDAFTLAAFDIGKIVVVYNPEKAPKRVNATIMEEISHILLDHEPTQISKHEATFSRGYNKEQEDEAKYVGWAALLPRKSLKWAINEKLTLEEISDHFGVSKEMVNYRLNRTNLKKSYKRSLS